MAESKIEWCDKSWPVVSGCTWKSPGCDNCYSVRMARRLGAMGHEKYAGLTTDKHFNGVVRPDPSVLDQPLRWRKPAKIFVASMSDLFHPDVPFEFIDRVFAVMARAKQHTFQVLTKRPDRMAEYLDHLSSMAADVFWDCEYERRSAEFEKLERLDCQGAKVPYGALSDCPRLDKAVAKLDAWRDSLNWPLPNVWLGTSVEDQQRANERIPHLLRCPAAVRFLSCEPLLGAVDLGPTLWEDGTAFAPLGEERFIDCGGCRGTPRRGSVGGQVPYCPGHEAGGIDWVIVGGESGPGARPMEMDWVRSIRDQCVSASVPFFFKQVGGTNKKAAGRLLDGREWSEFPGA